MVNDSENTVFESKTPGCASNDRMGQTDRRQLTWSEPQGGRTEQHQNSDLLQQLTTQGGRLALGPFRQKLGMALSFWLPFSVGMGRFGRSGGSKFRCGSPPFGV